MSRYIDADALKKRVSELIVPDWTRTLIRSWLDSEPTVDAVPVVASDRNKLCPINHGLRCKDIDNCAFWCEWGQCAVKAIAVACADGERRSDEDQHIYD